LENFDPAGHFAEYGVSGDEPHVYEDTRTGLAVAIASISYPLPTDEPTGGGPQLTRPGLYYWIWMNAVGRREFVPLATTIPSPE
jgi:hypothetical protein